MQLPPCSFRGKQIDDNRVECSCTSLMHNEEGVASVSTCLYPCPYRDEARETPRKSPPLYIKAFNFLSALSAHAIAGFPVVSPEQYKKRLDICLGCEYKHPTQNECTECGCPIEEKAAWAEQSCPLKNPKWLSEVVATPRPSSGCGGCQSK